VPTSARPSSRSPLQSRAKKELDEDGNQFDIACGYGRLKAFLALGEKTIPAVIIETSREEKGAACAHGELA
jgi:ParB-like chromosome segregation protein Spo0J